MNEEGAKRMRERLDKIDQFSRAALILCQRAESTLLSLEDDANSGAYCDIVAAIRMLEEIREEV